MDIYNIAKTIEQNGGKLYFVGGYVRDKLLNIDCKDIDFCITQLTEDKFLSLFPTALKTGKFFPVFRIENCEFAFARKEIKNGLGHNGFSTSTNNVTINDDLLRRDITINSIAIDVITNDFIDPANGIKDIKNKVIRANSSHFAEDPLRSYRVARFASTLGFDVERNTLTLMNSTKNELNTLSVERVFEELKKALSSNQPSIFFNVLHSANILNVHFKEIYDLIGIIQPVIYHPEGDVYNHSLIVLDDCSTITDNIEIRFSALVHDLGKALTPKEILPHHYGHDIRGIDAVKSLCNRLKMPTSWKKTATIVVREHMRAGLFNKMNFNTKVSFMEKNFSYLEALNIIAKVDSRKNDIDFFSIAKKMVRDINGVTLNLPNDIRAKQVLHSKRVEWLKNLS